MLKFNLGVFSGLLIMLAFSVAKGEGKEKTKLEPCIQTDNPAPSKKV